MGYNEIMKSSSPTVVSVTAPLNAPPHRVYATIADYHTGHPRILPKAFSNLVVERGGIGAGTVIRFDVTLLGQRTAFRSEVTEPEPGRVLVETNVVPGDSVSTFIVEPGASATESIVTIRTEFAVRSGVRAAIERFLTGRLLPPLYREELHLLEAAAAGPAGTAAPATPPA
jgi:hypothetical protein